ncbi:Pectic enzymes secretion protein OutD [Luteitalea pratensis]|uniref:Pectic enzymes secretion protein OutD n=1 Tax=Luteitalea pratensis TaxID=1855912 RepID=A0A143PVE4_LUTPR|nr:type II and III secretion system protein family protein [Luteitalea pratensis]AMY12266.1 Pectic enzymes secretion protein OutD [Luteitalea pratensis]
MTRSILKTSALGLALAIAGSMPLPLHAQGTRPATPSAPDGAFERITLTANRSRVLAVPFDIVRIAVTNPAVADAVVVNPREVLVDGKGPGTTSLIIWGNDARVQYDVAVDPGVATLEQHFKVLFPGEDIRVSVSDEAVILVGEVSSNNIVLRAGEIAAGAYAKSKVINMLGLPGGTPSQQVMLQVRFAEVNRRAVTELGATFISNQRIAARTTTQQYAGPDFSNDATSGLVFSDFLNLFVFDRQEGLGLLIKALQQNGYFQSLAEPNLIAYNGQEASFLAGGEFPVPIVQGGNTNAVTIQFKEFGIRLNFKPTIAGDIIRLRVRPEVSSLDFNNGITLQGFRVPSLTTRRAETDIELRDGQTFAVAGLLSNQTQTDGAAIPWVSKIPIIGNFFKSKADRNEQTELLVLITPRLVKPLDPDEVPALPTDSKRFLPPVDPTPRPSSGQR